ncbi:hypothetical protein MXD85_12860 [Staphylococcus aureus]|nr:hypothetical protein [Staphylococcus aureus]MCW1263841.1 hypothetical protein [Staphylococcus aureus]
MQCNNTCKRPRIIRI